MNINKQKYTIKDIRDAIINKIKAADKDFIIKEKDEYSLEITKKGNKDIRMGIGLSNLEKEINLGDDFDVAIKHRMTVFLENVNQMTSVNNMSKWEFSKDKIIFVPSSKKYCEHLIENMKNSNMVDGIKDMDDKIYYKGFIQDIVLAGAIDFPGFFTYLTTNMIKGWKKSDDEVYDQICKNMLKYDAKYATKQMHGVLHIIGGGDGTMLSPLLIKPKKLREIADKEGFKGKELVGSIPFRDVIMLAEYDMNTAMEIWRVGVAMIDDDARPYPVSPKLFMIDKDGVISTFKTDENQTGIAVAVNPKTGEIETLALDSKNDDTDLPSASSLEEAIHSNPQFSKAVGLLGKLSGGMPAKKFGEMVLEWTGGDKELSKMTIEKMVKSGMVTLKKRDNEVIVYPSNKTIQMIIEKTIGGKRKWD